MIRLKRELGGHWATNLWGTKTITEKRPQRGPKKKLERASEAVDSATGAAETERKSQMQLGGPHL